MTKTLTEQWREGKLPEGYYYTKLNDDDGTIVINYCWDDGCFQDYCDNMIDEVLASVPTYAEFMDLMSNLEYIDKYRELVRKSDELETKCHQLEKQLAIATKALKETKDRLLHIELSNLNYEERHKLYDIMFADGVIDRALLEMEGVK